MSISKLNKLKSIDLNCNVFDVYNYDGLSMQELLCQFFTKINECIKSSNETTDLASWLVNEGLEEEVVKKLMLWLNDGTLENLINTNLFNSLHNKIENISSKIDTNASEVSHLKNKISQINIKYPPSPLIGCRMDGATDDSATLQNILNYAEGLGRGVEIYIPNRKMVVNSTILIDFSKIKIKCDGEIITHMTTGTLIKEKGITPSNEHEVYEQGGIVVDGLKLVGSGLNKNTTAILLSSGNNNHKGSSRIKFKNCSIKSFGVGVEFSTRSYANTLDNCSIYDCYTCVKVSSGYDTGERITIINSSLFNSAKGIVCDNPESTVFIINTSIDYCTERLIQSLRGSVFVDNSHMEFSSEFYNNDNKAPFKVGHDDSSNLNITNSFIMCNKINGVKPSYIFEVDSTPFQGLTVSNCTLQGFNCTRRIVKGDGVVNFTQNNTKQWDGITTPINDRSNLFKDPYCNNLSSSVHTHIMLSNTDNLTLYRGDNEWHGSHCWKVVKNSNPQTLGEVVLFAPYNGVDKLIYGELEVISNVTCKIDIAYQGGRRKRNSGEIEWSDLIRVGQLDLISGQTTKFTPNNRHGFIDFQGYEYVAITLGLFNAPQGTFKIKNYWLHTF